MTENRLLAWLDGELDDKELTLEEVLELELLVAEAIQLKLGLQTLLQ